MQSIILSTHNFLTCFFINLSPSMGLFPLCLNYSLYNSCWLRLVDDNLLESLYYCSEMTLFYPRLWKIVLYLLFFHKWTSLLALFSSKEGGKLQVLFCLGYNHCYWKVSCQCNYCSVGVIYLLGLIFFFLSCSSVCVGTVWVFFLLILLEICLAFKICIFVSSINCGTFHATTVSTIATTLFSFPSMYKTLFYSLDYFSCFFGSLIL